LLVFALACGQGSENLLTQAEDAWDSGDYKESAALYEQYLAQDSTSQRAAEARFQLANVYYFNLNRHDQARVQYTAFLELDPSSPNAVVARERLAEVLGEIGRSYEAIAEYENLNPQDGTERRRIRLRIADLYFAQRNYSQALTEYEKVVEKVPYDDLSEQAYLREASIYHIARGQYQQALPIYRKLAAQSPELEVRRRAQYGIADCLAALYEFDAAIKTLQGITDEAEQSHVAERISELEKQRREAGQARSRLRQPT
jgi:tetratricopeptide (TPR) repeat protein